MKKLLTLLFFGILVCAINLRLPSVAAQSGNDPIPPQADWTAVDPFPTVTGTSRFVGAGGDLQAALNASRPGDEVVLQAGATFTGSFVLPVQSGTGWVVIRSSNLSSLTAGHRVDPAVDAGNMPKIVTNGTNVPALLTAGPDCSTLPCKVAQFYRVAGVEMTFAPGIESTGALVNVGDDWIADPQQLAQYIYFDRCYIHGLDGVQQKRGIAGNGRWIAVVDSHVSNFKRTDYDSQAFSAWNGPGPFKLHNSYFEGAGENVIFGGADPAIPNMVAGDITVTRNTMKKPLSWFNNDPSYAGTLWIVKNIFELKNAARVLVDGNDFEDTWEGEQIYAITLTPRNQDGHDNMTTVQDVTFTNNTVRHAAGGVSLLAEDNNFVTQVERRIKIANNVFDDISGRWRDQNHATDGVGHAFLISAALRGVAGPSDVTVDHNVFVTDGSSYIVIGDVSSNPRDVPNFTFTNNVVYHSLWGLKGDSGAPDGSGGSSSTFLMYFDNTLVFTNNAIVGTTDGTPSGPDWSAGYTSPPATLVGNVSANVFPKTWNDVGFVNFAAGDYHLAASSPYRTAGTGGSAIGADVDQIVAHQTGDGSSSLPPPWLQADVGQTGVAGSATYASSTGTFTVKGAGIDVWGTQDGFHYVYQPLNGDGQIVARVTHVDPTATFAKAAVMIRETLADNSAHVILDVKPDGENEFMTRPSTGATTQWLAGANQAAPAWLKLVFVGSIVTGSVSANGQSWTQVGQTTLNIASSAYVGLVVCAISTT
ncbi:MAG: hypothetical protein DMF86_18825 [Acidobacteria bacterium]|nr:MAG: hypothetical protein DMF86_18825 [Acidobacteriota bacterium]